MNDHAVSRQPPARPAPHPARNRGTVLPALGALLLAGLAARYAPAAALRWLPACPLHTLTGLYCPLCGGTRALLHLARGEWSAAWRSNPLVLAAAGVTLVVALLRLRPSARPFVLTPPVRRALLAGGGLLALVFMLLRNVHAPGSGWLGPPGP